MEGADSEGEGATSVRLRASTERWKYALIQSNNIVQPEARVAKAHPSNVRVPGVLLQPPHHQTQPQ